MSVRLSFCIPTANRADDLDRALWSIYADAVHHDALDRIEVCIADNASADATPELCAKWAARFPHFRSRRQETRRDFITNLLAATALATGDYLWLFGDDDSLVPGVLGTLFDALKSAPRLVHVAAITFSRASGGCGFFGVTVPITAPVSPVFASDLPQAAWGFISCLVFERKTWAASPRFAEREPAEVTTHIQVLADCLEAGDCLALHAPGVLIDKTPSRNAAWNGSWAVILGYEFLKARIRNFPPSATTRRPVKFPVRSFIHCYAVLSLLREHYGRLYSLAAGLPASAPLDVLVQKSFGALFASKTIRNAAIAVARRFSDKFRSRMALLESMAKDSIVS